MDQESSGIIVFFLLVTIGRPAVGPSWSTTKSRQQRLEPLISTVFGERFFVDQQARVKSGEPDSSSHFKSYVKDVFLYQTGCSGAAEPTLDGEFSHNNHWPSIRIEGRRNGVKLFEMQSR